MSSKSTRDKLLELSLPAIAVLYCLYALGEQYCNEARYSSLLYTLIITIPVLICGFFIARDVFKKEKVDARPTEKTDEPQIPSKNAKQLILFMIGLAVMISLLGTLGYLVCFSGFLVLCFRAFGIRSWKVIVPTTVCVLLFVYLVFRVWLDLEMPAGIWLSLLNVE